MSKPSPARPSASPSLSTRRSTTSARAKRRSSRHSRSWRLGWLSVLAVVVVIAVVVVVRVTSSPASIARADAHGETSLGASAETAVTHVPRSTLDAVGVPTDVSGPTAISGKHRELTSHGKPDIVYLGAEWCPYCATERWPLVEALSRFGTFSGLRATHSSSSDVYPNTATLSFYGSRFTSRYVSFTPVELATNQVVKDAYGVLQRPTKEETRLLSAYDRPPYSSRPGSIPFIDFANRYVETGASYDPQLLQGLTQAQIAEQLHNPKNPIAKGADGTANLMTAAICKLTGNQPRSACSGPAVAAARSVLLGGKRS